MLTTHWSWYPRRESNPRLLIESQVSWPLDDGGVGTPDEI